MRAIDGSDLTTCVSAFSRTMASPEEIAQELADVGELLTAQTDAGLDRTEVLQSLFNSWAGRLSMCARLSPKGKTIVTSAMQQGPWSADQKKDLASVILGGVASKTANVRRATQKVVEFQNFIKIQTMVKLRDHKLSRASRMSLLAAEARNIGVENADEKTLYRLVQILAYCENNFEFSQEQVWQYMDQIQAFIKSVPRRKDLPYLEHYPVTADLLPVELKRHAFASELPANMDIPELATVLGTCKMRGRPTTKRLQDKAPKWMNNVPQEHRHAVMAALRSASNGTDTAPAAASSENSLSTADHPSKAALVTAPIADCFRFQAPPMINAAPVAQSADDEDCDPDQTADPNTIDDLEMALIGAVADRKKGSSKKSPTKARPAAASSALKRPAAANMKRPATSSLMHKTHVGTWKNIHSKVYHTAREAEFKKSGDDVKAKAVASAACARAKVKFMKGTLKF